MKAADEDTARALGALKEVDRPVALGEHLVLDPCVSEGQSAVMLRQIGRSCPRPDYEIEPENAAAFELVMLSCFKHARAWASAIFKATVPAYRRATVARRIAAVLVSPAIIDRMYPSREKAEGA